MRIAAGELDRRIVILRPYPVDDGMATRPGPPVEIGKRSARKRDASDGDRGREAVKAGQRASERMTRFLVRADGLTRTIVESDIIQCRSFGRVMAFEVVATKESDEREDGIEITAVSIKDAPEG